MLRLTKSTGSIDSLSRLTTHTAVASSHPDHSAARGQSACRSGRAVWDDGCASVVLAVRWSVVDLAGRPRRRHASWGVAYLADRSMSPRGDWELNWGLTWPFCQLTRIRNSAVTQVSHSQCSTALHMQQPSSEIPEYI